MPFKVIIVILLLVPFFLVAEEGSITLVPETKPDSTEISAGVFSDLEDDYRLVKLFLSSQQKKKYKNFTDDEKKRFVNDFWLQNDPNPVTEVNEFVEAIKARVNFSNASFSHFKDGWKTDRGRIFIKYGQPFEVIKENTGMYSKYSQKEYEIWKYRVDSNRTFIFIDLQTHGDYRLIYSENDDTEITLPDWKDYLGLDFDESILY